jgi:protein SCO1/2
MERRRRPDEDELKRKFRMTRTSWAATPIALFVISVIAAAAVRSTTFGLRAWTTEEVRRLRVQANPPALGSLQLISSAGTSFVPWDQTGAGRRVWLVTFMYTRCPTLCTTLGVEFERLQRALGSDPHDERIRLLSISFDTDHDDVRALQSYATHHHADPDRWVIAVPASASDLKRLEQQTGIVVIDDGLGGYAHNAAIHVVLADRRLVRIFDFNRPEAALAWARTL